MCEIALSEFETHIFFDEPIFILLSNDVVLPNIDSPDGNEIIHEALHLEPMVNSNHPLSTYGVNGVTDEFELHSMSGPHYPQPISY